MAVLFNPFTGEFTVSGGGSTTTNSFSIIQPDSGTSPTATSSASILTITSSANSSLAVIGDSVTNTLSLALSSNPSFTSVSSDAFEGTSSAGFAFGTAQPYESINFGNLTNDGTLRVVVGEYSDISIGGSASIANTISIGSPNTSTTVFGPMFFGYADVDFDGSDVKNIYNVKVNNGVSYADAGRTHWVTLKSPVSLVNSYDLLWPDDQGAANTYLKNNGSGTLSWATVSSGAAWGSITGTLSSQTDLNTALSGKQATGNYITALTGEVTASGPGSVSSTVSNAAVIGKVLTGFSAASGTVASTDTILQAVNKLVGNDALKAPIASPTFTGVITAPSNSISASAVSGLTIAYFGDGVDGALTISAGTTTLTRDMFYSNVTISGTASINTAGFRMFVSGTLDLTAAPANAITGTGNAGGTTATAAGGAAGAALAAGTLGTGGAGGAGASGGTAAGGTGTSAATQLPANGGTGGDGNTGGTGSSGGGGGGGTGGALSFGGPFNRIAFDLQRGLALYIGGAGGGGGGGGGGDTVQAGGGGGGGGGGRVLYIAANVVSRGGSTAVGAISADGGAGGSGATISGNKGGGAGGGGGGGGWVYMLVGSTSGSTATNAISVTGGLGGSGANGSGTGTGGKGGNGGSGGRITLLNLGTNTITSIFGSTGTAGSNNTGITGGAGGAGNVTRVSL